MADDVLQPSMGVSDPSIAGQPQFVSDPAGGPPLQFIPDSQFVPDELNTTENLKALGESVGRGAIPAFTAIERGLGVKAEDIARRQQMMGPSDMLWSTLGFVAPAIMSGGASALGKVGALAPETVAAAKAASEAQLFQSNLLHGIAEGATLGMKSQVAKQALSGAIEAGLLSAGDEAHRYLIGDDENTHGTALQSAMLRVGANAVLGGALGSVSGLWAARNAPKVAEDLSSIIRDAESTTPEGFFEAATKDASAEKKQSILKALREQKENANEINAAGQIIGAPVPEGMTAKAKIIQDMDSSLVNAPTFLGAARQNLYSQGYDAAQNAIKEAFSTTLPTELSERDLGESLVNSLSEKISNLYGPVNELHDVIKESTPFIDVNPKSVNRVIKNLLNQDAVKITGSSPAAAFIRKIATDLENVSNVDQLRAVIGSLKQYSGENPTLNYFAADIRDRLKNLEMSSIEGAAKNLLVPGYQQAKTVEDLLKKIDMARELYAPFKGDLVTAAKGLGLGKIEGYSDFLHKLTNAKPELLVKRIFAKDNARFLEFFADRFPEEAKLVMDFKKSELLDQALKTGELRYGGLFNNIEKLSPEQLSKMFSEEELKKLNAARTWIQNVPKNINPSGTTKAAAFNEFWKNILSAITMTAGDSAKLAFLKFLKSDAPISSTGFKAAADYFSHATGGMTDIQKAVKDVFHGAKIVIPEKLIDRNLSLDPLDRKIQSLQQKPEKHFEMAGELPYYLPKHSTALTETTANMAQYLNSQRPTTIKQNMLDAEMPPTPEKQQAYYRTLSIAQSPLVVLKHVQDGTLQVKDAVDLNRMYPDLHNFINQQVTNTMIEHLSEGKPIPFQTRKALSILTGQHLDSTMTPQAIQSAQNVFAPPPMQPQMAQPRLKKSTAALTHFSKNYETASETRLAHKQKA